MNHVSTSVAVVQDLLHDPKQLLEKTTIEQRSRTLVYASRHNDIDAARAILSYSDATYDNSDALEWAVFHNNLQMLQLLLPHSNPKQSYSGCLRMSLQKQQYDMVDLLYEVSDVQEALKALIEDFGYKHHTVINLKQRMKAERERAALNGELCDRGNTNIKRKM